VAVFDLNPDSFQFEDLDRIINQSQELMRGLEQAQDGLAEVVGEGTAADGLIHVQVDGSGMLKDLTLNPRVMRLDSTTLAAELTQAIGAAHADVQRKVSELMSGVAAEFGMDPEPMNPDKLRDQFQDIQASFDRKMDARTDEFQRRMRD
jgi:DNA-binding protein YbaB